MKLLYYLTAGLLLAAGNTALYASEPNENRNIMEHLTLTTDWDKTFPKSDKVDHSKGTFVNRYGITLAADMYRPKGATGRLPAIAVCGPFGAVKEQAAGLYAQEMAERGFLTIAFDPSFTGESGGTPRYMTSPDINTEDFSAAVDYLVTNGYFDADDSAEARNALRNKLAAQRTEDYRTGTPSLGGGVPDVLPEDAPKFLRDYHDYYKTAGASRSLNSNGGRAATSPIPWINFPLMSRAGEIESAVMILHGEKAHSFYFGSDTYKKLTVTPGRENNKLFMVVPGASHTDLYDRKDIIPFASIEKFFDEYIGR